jgi:phage terminase large subunit-like protein
VDPADTGKGDAAGILVAGVTPGGQIVFVADESAQLSQAQWARKACLAWIRHGASRIVQEHNLGMRTSIPDAWALLYRQATALADAGGHPRR